MAKVCGPVLTYKKQTNNEILALDNERYTAESWAVLAMQR